MPPPSRITKDNTRSQYDHKNYDNSEDCNSESSISQKGFGSNLKNETVGLVKSILGPTLEDSVLRTLEFGKSLIHNSDEPEKVPRAKKALKSPREEIASAPQKKFNLEVLLVKDECERKNSSLKGIINLSEEKGKTTTALTEYAIKLDQEEMFAEKTKPSFKKPSNVSKIRSLDSDLKQCSQSPQKIKKQLEALIQINKDEPPERSWNLLSNASKIPVEMTVMPSLCMYKNEAEMNYSSSCDVQSQASRTINDLEETIQRSRSLNRKRLPSKICQAPEFLSNALGPTIDVSIIDNIKMMRDLLKNENGKGEGSIVEPINVNQQMKQEIRLQNSEAEMACRIQELQRQIEELEDKEQCLLKQIEEEESVRDCRRREFEEEERKFCEKKACLEALGERKKSTGKSMMECSLEAKLDAMQGKIAQEENKLEILKCEYDQYKREIAEAKYKKQALKRNKALLDAWDVFASRVCHTRLPSFSRAHTLERKQFPMPEPANLHCCFPTMNPPESQTSGCNNCENLTDSKCDECSSKDQQAAQETQVALKSKLKMGEINFPIQRDVFCGLHQMLKSCNCYDKSLTRGENPAYNGEAYKRSTGTQGDCCNANIHTSSLVLEPTPVQSTVCEKHACQSKSDTPLRSKKCSKIVEVMWAVTRINIFQNNYRTYEILEATSTAPSYIPTKTEGIFVVKSHRKPSSPPSRKKRSSNVTTH